MNKTLIYSIIILLILIGVFFGLNKYIYEEKQADYIVGETKTLSGEVLAVNLEGVAADGPAVITLKTESGELFNIAIPSFGLPLCPAYQGNNIGDVFLIKAGEMIEVRGSVSEDGSIVPCELTEHYFRTKPIIVSDFEGEADPSRMTLGMKTWIWKEALYNDERRLTPLKAGAFTISFSENGRFSATTDCNSASGSYSAKENLITFSQIASTKMFCESSQESEFIGLLTNSTSYHFTSKGELILDLKFDSGSVIFK